MINKIIVITSIMHKRCNDSMKAVNGLLENELKDIESNVYDINKEPIIAIILFIIFFFITIQ